MHKKRDAYKGASRPRPAAGVVVVVVGVEKNAGASATGQLGGDLAVVSTDRRTP